MDAFRQHSSDDRGADVARRDVVVNDTPVAERLGNYELGERIGGGGMGVVYRAFHTRLKTHFALKVMRLDHVRSDYVARFTREMEAVGQLQHPNIVRATDAGECAGVLYLVMELIDGIDLQHLIQRAGPLSVPDACELVRQTALGLQYAHENGVVHRDIKPSNLMLARDGQVKILDLGLARPALPSGDDGLTAVGRLVGTPDYMSPEQWLPGGQLDARTDLYSLGCTLYALLAGRPPFSSPDFPGQQKMAAHLQLPAPSIRAVRPDVPEHVAAIVARLLAKAPEARYPQPIEVAGALEPYVADASLGKWAAARQATPSPAPGTLIFKTTVSNPLLPTGRWRRTLQLGGALALLLLIGGLILVARAIWPAVRERNPGPAAGAVVFEPGKRYDLLAKAPVEKSWAQPMPGSLWTYYPEEHALFLNCLSHGIPELGTMPTRRFDLEIEVSKDSLAGGFGFYFERSRYEKAVWSELLFWDGTQPPAPTLVHGRLSLVGRESAAIIKDVVPIPSWKEGRNRLIVAVGRLGLDGIICNDQLVPPRMREPIVTPGAAKDSPLSGASASTSNMAVRSFIPCT